MAILESVNKYLKIRHEFHLKSTPIKYNRVKVTQTIKDGQVTYKLKGPTRDIVATLIQMNYGKENPNEKNIVDMMRKSQAYTSNKTGVFYFIQR